MQKSTITLSALAALRLTRFITRDTLADWTIVRPAERWAASHEGAYYETSDGLVQYVHPAHVSALEGDSLQLDPEAQGWRVKLVSGLSCPHCVGFWITAGTLAAGAFAERHSASRTAFNFAAGSLGLSYIISHISQRLDS